MSSLFHLLQHAAAEQRDRPAVVFGEQSITYADFLDAADRLAGFLSARGAEPGRRIAFSFQKSIEGLIALFGIIRTGATYVPLDPAWPADRMTLICRDAGIELWLGTNAPIGIDAIKSAIAVHPSGDRCTSMADALPSPPARDEPRAPADDLANILYTSGSTGRPKGVQITSLSLLHYSQWACETFAITPGDRLANHAPYNFDLSTLDIFAAVRAGATMVPVPERIKMFPYQMARFIADQRISIWYSVPSALIMMQLRGKLPDHDCSRLRHILFAGEVMPKPALQALAREIPHPQYANLYGPTETNVCTWHPVSQADLDSDDPLPIGRAISDTGLWMIDEESNSPRAIDASAPRAAGELLVAGPTVTTGYCGDAELTARRLIPAPDGRGMAYRTGDRVSLREDGVLLFHGRTDRMIKRGGHRIEPGDIEAALAQHPAVKEAAIVPLPDPVFGCRIKACLAPREGHSLVEAELTAFCRERLPAYMLPDVWAIYPSLPRTDREKIDLRALAAVTS